MKEKLKIIAKAFRNNLIPSLAYRGGTGGSVSARYCYSVWLRHLITAYEQGMGEIPLKIAEFGPGDSMGVGLCAILCGASEYYGFDYIAHADANRNLKIFDELVEMYKKKTDIPDNIEFPNVYPTLMDYSFPSKILTDNILAESLNERRLNVIRKGIEFSIGGVKSEDGQKNDGIKIKYVAPWNEDIDLSEIDYIISQGVLHNVDGLEEIYAYFGKIIKPDGYMSNVMDFSCRNTSPKWNGHWGYSERFWKIYRGRLPYLINREPISTHINFCEKNGFRIIGMDKKIEIDNSISRKRLKHPFMNISEDDFRTSAAYILCQKQERQDGG